MNDKTRILGGTSVTETVPVDRLAGEPVDLRPLTDLEVGIVQSLVLRGVNVTAESIDALELDLEQLTTGSLAAMRTAVAYSMSIDGGDTWTADDVGQLRAGAVEEIYRHVVRITGVDPLANATTRGDVIDGAARFRSDD